MNQDDVIRLAVQCQLMTTANRDGLYADALEAFAKLVAEHERSECAKVCDFISEDQWALYKGRPPYTGQELERASDYTQGKSDGAEASAEAIRARKEA